MKLVSREYLREEVGLTDSAITSLEHLGLKYIQLSKGLTSKKRYKLSDVERIINDLADIKAQKRQEKLRQMLREIRAEQGTQQGAQQANQQVAS